MANKEMIRIRLKAYDHQIIDSSAEKIVETASATALRFPAPFPFLPRRKSLPIFVQCISTRTAVSSSSAAPTRD